MEEKIEEQTSATEKSIESDEDPGNRTIPVVNTANSAASSSKLTDDKIIKNDSDEVKSEDKENKKKNLAEKKKKEGSPPEKEGIKSKLKIDEESEDKKPEDDVDEDAIDYDISGSKENTVDKNKAEPKEKNGNRTLNDKKKRIDKDNDKNEDDKIESSVVLSSISKINDNINKTRVDGLQVLHLICFGSQGKNNVVKKNLRGFAGFEFEIDSSEYKRKYDFIKKTDTKSLRGICDILSLERKGSKEEVAERILKFLKNPTETMLTESMEEDEEEDDYEEEEIEDEEAEDIEEQEEEISEEDTKPQRKRPNAQSKTRGGSGKNSTERPRRATAGKKMSAYVDFSSSEESVQKAPVSKRRRRNNDDSESGSDYNPSGANSESDGGRGKRQQARLGGRGRPAGKTRRRNSDFDDEESEFSEVDSDVPKRKRSTTVGKGRGRPPAVSAGSSSRGRRSVNATKKQNDSESEEEATEEDLSELENDISEDESKKKEK